MLKVENEQRKICRSLEAYLFTEKSGIGQF